MLRRPERGNSIIAALVISSTSTLNEKPVHEMLHEGDMKRRDVVADGALSKENDFFVGKKEAAGTVPPENEAASHKDSRFLSWYVALWAQNLTNSFKTATRTIISALLLVPCPCRTHPTATSCSLRHS